MQVKSLPSPPRKEKKKQRFGPMGEILDKSYDSMASDEKDEVHYEIESDNEPPHDEVGDILTVVKKGQVTKTILEVSINMALKFYSSSLGRLRHRQTR